MALIEKDRMLAQAQVDIDFARQLYLQKEQDLANAQHFVDKRQEYADHAVNCETMANDAIQQLAVWKEQYHSQMVTMELANQFNKQHLFDDGASSRGGGPSASASCKQKNPEESSYDGKMPLTRSNVKGKKELLALK